MALDELASPAPAAQQTPARLQPSLPEFERAIARRDYQTALAHALGMLSAIDRAMGGIETIDLGTFPTGLDIRDVYVRFATRFAAGFSDLIVSGGSAITPLATEALFLEHRWLDNLFAISGFQTTDHMAIHFGGGRSGQWQLSTTNLTAFLLLFMPSASAMEISFEDCMSVNRAATLVALISYLAARICVTPRACAFRERMLQWLPGRFGDAQLGTVPLQRMTEPYTHCSYAMDPGKHRLKADLIAQMHNAAVKAGCLEYDPATPRPKRDKPVVVVVTEHFTVGHAIHRTHSEAVRALRERFHVIGVLHGEHHQPGVLDCFDEVIGFPMADLFQVTKTVSDAILERQPDVVIHLGVGLTVTAIALASLRLAPVQCVSYGHTATTMSPAIDYMVLPEDFVLSKDCYSEELLLLPKTAFPYTPRVVDTAAVDAAIAAAPDPAEGVVRIAVPASVMKINSVLLDALAKIAAGSTRPVEFHFFPLGARGVAFFYMEREIKRQLPLAVVHHEVAHDEYLKLVAACAFFLCPFPYGNMNSIVDAVSLGLPGVCLDGPEAHSHADVAIFARMGLPKALAASTIEDYVDQAVRLANDPAWLAKCRKAASNCDLKKRFYDGDPRQFSEAIYALVKA